MKKEIFQEIEIPAKVEANIKKGLVTITGPQGEIKRDFNLYKISLEKKDGKIIIGNKKSTKNEKRRTNTISAHIRNMIKGVQEKFEYKLKVCFVHFPSTLEIKGNKAIIKNFLGEKYPREFQLPQNVEIKNEGGIISVSACDLELAGQTAATFEAATRISKRDRRVFQDGIFITHKPGREM
jgi:large subunit ribosomal protein L6